MTIVNLFDYEQLAQASLRPEIWDYFHGGSGDEITLRENRSAFERIKLLPRVLRNVDSVDMETVVQGSTISLPVIIAPTAFHCLLHPEGECATGDHSFLGAGKPMYSLFREYLSVNNQVIYITSDVLKVSTQD